MESGSFHEYPGPAGDLKAEKLAIKRVLGKERKRQGYLYQRAVEIKVTMNVTIMTVTNQRATVRQTLSFPI